MMKKYSNWHRAESKKRAMHWMVPALFLCSALSARAQSNTVIGTAFGTNYSELATATTISSEVDGDGYLVIGWKDTTGITLSNNVSGTIGIGNNFDNFTITATGGTITSATNMLAPALSVSGGTNLNIIGGNFLGSGGASTITIEGPPPPGGGSSLITLHSTNATVGGAINSVQFLTISNSTFKGATYAPSLYEVHGTDGLNLNHVGTNIIDGTSTFVGGAGGSVDFATTNTMTYGGCGLSAYNNSTVIVSNGTFQGGSTGDASAGSGFTSTSIAGPGLFVKDSTLHIVDGTFTGGDTGSADTSIAGAGILAIDSDITVDGGTFTGGQDGTKSFYGLLSNATAGKTNSIALNGGTFNFVGFGGEGMQLLSTGTNGPVISDSMVLISGTLIATNQNNAPFQTTTIQNGTMRFTENFNLANAGRLYIASTEATVDFAGDFTASSNATLWISAHTNGTGTITADNAYFHADSILAITNQLAGLSVGSSVTSTVVSATSDIHVITSGGTTNSATDSNFAENVNIYTNAAKRTGLADIMLDGGNLKLRFTTKTLREHWNATGQFGDLADELDDIDNKEMLTLIDNNPNTSGPLVEQTYFTTMNTFQTAMQGLQAAVGQSVSRGAEFREELKLLPPGAKGPQRNNDLRGWGKYHGQFYSHDTEGLNSAYDATLHGGVIGVDTSLGNLLLGLSGGGGNYSTTTGSDGKEDIRAYHGALYGTYGTDRAYFDAGIAYGFNAVETRTSGPFVLNGEFDAEVATAYLGGGYNLIDTDGGTIFRPEASIQYSMYEQDAYSETSDNAVPRNIDAFDADSLRSSLGLNVSMLNTTALKTFGFKLDGRFHWLHEFNPDPGNMSFSLEGGSNDYQLAHPLLDEELFRVGFGFSFFNTMRNKPKNVLLRFDFDELLGDGFNSHNLSAKLIYAF